MDEREALIESIHDKDLISYFYLDIPASKVLERMDGLNLTLLECCDEIPFNAQVKGYIAARDSAGDPWIVKPIHSEGDVLYHRICTLAFLLDNWMGTFAAPTTVFPIGGMYYRATKVVRNSVNIGSYNYLDSPFIDIIRADLINRWLYFDEDRNPNNYLVIHNSQNKPFIVAIDYDKADLQSERMKITGTNERFGWLRSEKTRFLTLLKPENFDGVPLETFSQRLTSMMSITEDELTALVFGLLSGYQKEPEATVSLLVKNICDRRAYIDTYFRSWFKPKAETKSVMNEADYMLFGKSFIDIYQGKKNGQ